MKISEEGGNFYLFRGRIDDQRFGQFVWASL